jgi:Flp pilus assembly protein TadG
MKYSVFEAAVGRRGAAGMFGAIAVLSLVGVAGLAIDIGAAYVQQARLQAAADSAALGGALSWIKSGGSGRELTATISSVVTANGWPGSVIRNPGQAYLASSPKNPRNPAVQVTLTAPSSLTLLRVLVPSMTSITTGATAVAEIGRVGQPACVLSLTQIIVDNGADVSAKGCSVAANSSANNAILLNTGGKLTADSINTPGQVLQSNGSHLSGTVHQGAPAIADPYSSYQEQANGQFSNCQSYNNQATISAGCWSNVNVNSGSSLTLQPGTYFFTNLNVNSGASLTGTGGVTIVAQNNFSPNGDITITAPTTGGWAGMAIYAMGGMNVNSGVRYNVSGTVYAPTSALIPDSGSWNQNACTYFIVQSITFNSGAKLIIPQNNCGTYGFPVPVITGSTTVALVQ